MARMPADTAGYAQCNWTAEPVSPQQNAHAADARHRSRVEFLHAGEIGIADESLVQMRVAHDQQRDQQ